MQLANGPLKLVAIWNGWRRAACATCFTSQLWSAGFSVVCATAMLLAALDVAMSPQLRVLSIRTTVLSWLTEGEAILRIDTLSSVLLPFAAALWLLTVAVTPRAALDRRGLRRTVLATLITFGSFLTESAVMLLLLSVASVWTFWSGIADPAHQYQRRIVAAYLGVSTLL